MDDRQDHSPDAYAAEVPNPRTRENRLRHARDYVAWAEMNHIDIRTATTTDIVRYLDLLRQSQMASSVLTIQRSLRAYYKWLEARGFVVRSPLAHLRDDKLRRKPPRHVPPEDIRRLLDASKSDRDWSIIAIMAFNSLRTSEVLGCDVEDFEARDGLHLLHFRPSGQHRRRPAFVVLADEVAARLTRQLGPRRTGPLFVSRDATRLGRTSVYSSVFGLTSERAGLPYQATPDLVRNSLPVTAIQRGFSYRGVVRAIGVPDRRHSERWISLTDGPAQDNASLRFARLTLHPPDSSESMLLHIESVLDETDLPDPFAVTVAGAVFERHLFELCVAHDLELPAERKDGKINKYVHQLRRSGVFTLADQKLSEGIAEARNNAAHGAFDLLSPTAGRDVLRNVGQLVARHPLPMKASEVWPS